jgi:serine/threonine-protein kinase RsbW
MLLAYQLMGGKKKIKKFEIASQTDQIKIVVDKLDQFLNQAGVIEPFISEVSLAVSEATANAIIHGNKQDEGKKVSIAFCLDDDSLKIKIKDQGIGFQPTEIPNPLSDENRMKRSGRGIYLIKASMDQVKFEGSKKGMAVELIKYRKKTSP